MMCGLVQMSQSSMELLFTKGLLWGIVMSVYNVEFRVKPNSRLRAFIDYLFIRRTPSCILCDDSLVQLAPMLRGTVIELGGYKKLKYSTFATQAEKYLVTNISGDYDEFVDILNMKYADNSIDSFICVNVLEHICYLL